VLLLRHDIIADSSSVFDGSLIVDGVAVTFCCVFETVASLPVIGFCLLTNGADMSALSWCCIFACPLAPYFGVRFFFLMDSFRVIFILLSEVLVYGFVL
jgi:hypothetical protein